MQASDDPRFLLEDSPKPGKRAAIIMAVLVHLLLAGFLIYGIRWQSSLPEAVEVELVRAGPPVKAEAAPPVPEAKPEPRPEPRPEPPSPEPKVQPKPVTPPKPDIAIKEKPEKKPDPKPQYDPMQEMLKRETEQQKHAQLREALAREDAAKTSAQASARSKGLADYSAKIRGKIRGNLMVPPGATGNPEAEFLVTQLPSGEVIEVKLRKSTGQPVLDQAIERAIHKSSPLPLPERKEDFVRELKLQFRPLEQTSPN